ncbi:uncharacterized protein LOC142341022 isoform X2 [Convolutriloba macropyga]|uniref:uncharacterized protein LOC142341022 isoform X2 n=1 Tax=Convolutriloba macropyga TaxID=536237 RepID=UPI003F51DC57
MDTLTVPVFPLDNNVRNSPANILTIRRGSLMPDITRVPLGNHAQQSGRTEGGPTLTSSSPQLKMSRGPPNLSSFTALPEINDDGVQKSPTTRNEEQEETSSRRFTTESDNLAERQLEELQEYKNLREYAVGVNKVLLQKVPTPSSGPSISTMINTKIRSKKFKDLIIGDPTSEAPNASREFRKAMDRHMALDSSRGKRGKKISGDYLSDSVRLRKISQGTRNKYSKMDNATSMTVTKESKLSLLQVPLQPQQNTSKINKHAGHRSTNKQRKSGGFAIQEVERANSDAYKTAPQDSAKLRRNVKVNSGKNDNNVNNSPTIRVQEQSSEHLSRNPISSYSTTDSASRAKNVRFIGSSRRQNIHQSANTLFDRHPSSNMSAINRLTPDHTPGHVVSSYRTRYSSDMHSVLPSRGLESHRAHELVNKLMAIQTAQKVDINILGKLFQDEEVHKLRLAITRYPPAVLNILERAEARMRNRNVGLDLSVTKIEEMRAKRQRAIDNPSLMESWAPSRVLYSKSLLPT